MFASLASAGHTYPMIPLAVALREAGHEVHFAAGDNVHEPLAENGLRPFRPADAFYEMYAEDLEPELARLKPHLVIHGWGVPEAAIAAQRAGIPVMWHGFGRMFPEGIGLRKPTGGRHLDICPPSLQDKDFLATERRLELRPVPYGSPPQPPARDSARGNVIYLTFGTAFGTAELLTTAIAGLARLDALVLVAAGRVPVDQLGSVPPNVTVRQWVPQAKLLQHADVVVHHGGSGTTLGALAAGVPQLVLPQGADQFANAEALRGAGAALSLLPGETSAEAIAEQACKLLAHNGNGHRDAARAIAGEIARMPSPREVAGRLPEMLGRDGA
jgi:UDP:flavonoid glycosyltransferase YjiC (YdhE family)